MKEFLNYAKSKGVKSIDIDTLSLISNFLKERESEQFSLQGVRPSLLCVNSKSHNFITVGNRYKILQKLDDSCIIVNDYGIQQIYKIDCFENQK